MGWVWMASSASASLKCYQARWSAGQLQILYTISNFNLFQLFVLSGTDVYQAALCYTIFGNYSIRLFVRYETQHISLNDNYGHNLKLGSWLNNIQYRELAGWRLKSILAGNMVRCHIPRSGNVVPVLGTRV